MKAYNAYIRRISNIAETRVGKDASKRDRIREEIRYEWPRLVSALIFVATDDVCG